MGDHLQVQPFPSRGSPLTSKMSRVSQSKTIKGAVWAGLGGKGLRKRDGKIGVVVIENSCILQHLL